MKHTQPFGFGCAKNLYQQSRHPRILCDAEGLASLQRKTASGSGRKLADALRRKVRPLVELTERTDDPPLLIAHHTIRKPGGSLVLAGLQDMALIGALDDDARTTAAVRKLLAAMPDADTKGPRDSYSLAYSSVGPVQLAYDFTHGAMSTQERGAFTRWLLDASLRRTLAVIRKGHYLRSAGFNVAMDGMMTAAMSYLAIVGDEGVPDLDEEKAELLRYFEATLYAAICANGYPSEDIAYGSGMICYLSRVVEATRRAGLFDAYAQCPRYGRFGRAMLHFVQPWGRYTSNTGDFGASFGERSLVLPRIASETRDPSVLWLAGTLRFPTSASGPMDMAELKRQYPEVELAPGFRVPVDAYSLLALEDLRRPLHPSKSSTPTHYMDPDRGIVTFRSSWKDDATFVVFDGSQRRTSSQGHEHDSGGHFSLSALGEYFAIDTGRYNIEQDQHNVVLVDGKSGRSTDGQWRMSYYHSVLTGFRPGEFVDTASVDNSHQSDCYWSRRTLGLVKGATPYVWTVEDVNPDHGANGPREFWWTMNVNPNHKITIHQDHATVTGSDHGNCLDAFFVIPNGEVHGYPSPHEIELTQDVKLSGSEKYLGRDRLELAREYRQTVGLPEYGPVYARPRLIGKVAGYNGRFMSLMIPRLKGRRPPRVEALPAFDNVLAARITFEKFYDTVIWAYEHHLLEAGGERARGDWTVIRRSRATGRVIAQAVGGGDEV